MASNIKKPAPQPHVVVIDTNMIWYGDKSKVVNPDFETFWNNYSLVFPMELKIPKVVIGEILFQQTTSAIKLLKLANENIEKISSITEKKYKHRIEESRIKREIENRLLNWTHSKNVEIIEPPIDNINWNDVINRSIWRILPFTPDEKNPENEKGFRDMIILETLTQVCVNTKKDKKIAFLCNDNALRKAAEDRFKALQNFSTYDSIKNFESFIELTQQNLTESFVRRILFRAREKFFKSNDSNCLYYKYRLRNMIEEKYKSILSPHETEEKKFSMFSISNPELKPIENQSVTIERPQFDKVESSSLYYWKNRIIFKRKFEQRFNSGFLLMEGSNDCTKKLLVVKVTVKWKSQVAKDGRFYNCEIVDFNEHEEKFEPMVEE